MERAIRGMGGATTTNKSNQRKEIDQLAPAHRQSLSHAVAAFSVAPPIAVLTVTADSRADSSWSNPVPAEPERVDQADHEEYLVDTESESESDSTSTVPSSTFVSHAWSAGFDFLIHELTSLASESDPDRDQQRATARIEWLQRKAIEFIMLLPEKDRGRALEVLMELGRLGLVQPIIDWLTSTAAEGESLWTQPISIDRGKQDAAWTIMQGNVNCDLTKRRRQVNGDVSRDKDNLPGVSGGVSH